MTERALRAIGRSEPWRQRLIRSLLYGRNVDRAAKARARVGLAILAFAAVYAVLAGTPGDVRGRRRQPRRAPHRIAGRDCDRAPRYRRPQWHGARHRRQESEPVRRTAAHHRQGRGDRTVDRGAAGPRRSGGTHAPVVAQGLCLAEARDHAEAAAEHPQARHSRHRLPAREQARLPDRRVGRASDRPRQYRQPGHRRDGEMAGQ